ncbi:hypothetical protein PIB30_088330, partial [Stylosanthes scabra]|nr:hypothetical protein [Stylosanthes scabra]
KAKFVVPVLNVGGRLGEDENGVLKYIDGVANSFQALDVDLLTNLEFGLREIKNVSNINELRNSLVEHECVDFHVFFEHSISEPVIAEGVETFPNGGCVNLDSDDDNHSSSHDSYESAEDEAYKHPPDGYELSSDSDGGESKKVKKRGTAKKIMTPTKKASPKKNLKKTPIRRSSRRLGSQDNNADDGLVDDAGEKENDEEAAETIESEKKMKKRGSRKYAGKRKEKSRPNFGLNNNDSRPNGGPNSSGSQPNSDVGAGQGGNGP